MFLAASCSWARLKNGGAPVKIGIDDEAPDEDDDKLFRIWNEFGMKLLKQLRIILS